MSHKATHWLASIQPESITHGEFRILFHLCDCHNPSAGCFPSQAYLRNASGGSNGGVNKWLLGLEDKGFIKRELDFDPKTRKRKPTQYTLGFEMEPCPKSGHGSGAKPKLTSGNATVSVEPCPNSGHGSDEFSGRNPTPLSGDGANSTFEAKPTPLLGQSQGTRRRDFLAPSHVYVFAVDTDKSIAPTLPSLSGRVPHHLAACHHRRF